MKLTLMAALAFLPPLEYDVAPAKPYAVWELSRPDLTIVCGYEDRPDMHVWGCADIYTNEVFILESLDQPVRDIIIRHELAHLNGWDHP